MRSAHPTLEDAHPSGTNSNGATSQGIASHPADATSQLELLATVAAAQTLDTGVVARNGRRPSDSDARRF